MDQKRSRRKMIGSRRHSGTSEQRPLGRLVLGCDPSARPGGRNRPREGFLGTSRCCPTLITAPVDALKAGLAAIDAACNQDVDINRRVLGIHLEGPYISHIDGYRGAHPLDAVHDPDWDEFQSLQDAAGGRITLLTLAPERTDALPFIRKVVDSGVTVAPRSHGRRCADAPRGGGCRRNLVDSSRQRHRVTFTETSERDLQASRH